MKTLPKTPGKRRALKALVLVLGAAFSVAPESVQAQNKFFSTSNRGVEGGKGNAQIKMLMDENALRRDETTQNASDISGLDARMGTAEGAITTLDGTVSGHTSTLSDHSSRIGTLETETADVENHAKAAMPGMCHEANAKLRWNTTTSVWECLPEGDPTVQPFAKTSLPTCSASQLLRSTGSGFTCVNAGSDYVITESDPKVGTTTSGRWCRGTGSQVTCDQDPPAATDPQIGTITGGKWCKANGSRIDCTYDAPTGSAGGEIAVSKYGSGNRCVGDDYIAVCGYAPGAAWNYNTCYGRGHAATYGWSLAWNAASNGYEYSGSGTGPVDVICSGGSGGTSTPPETCSTVGAACGGGIAVTTGSGALIAATNDAPVKYAFGPNANARGATSAQNGAENTNTLMFSGVSHPAASYCSNLSEGGFSDWYLPAKDELNALYGARSTIGGFATSGGTTYWSSTENYPNQAWFQVFGNGSQNYGVAKETAQNIRCVRRSGGSSPPSAPCSTVGGACGGGVAVTTGSGALVVAASDAPSSLAWDAAVSYCSNSSLNGYSDWSLPTWPELNQLYANRDAIGGFTVISNLTGNYWSSQEQYNDYGWSQNFDHGSYHHTVKTNSDLRVRCVRQAD